MSPNLASPGWRVLCLAAEAITCIFLVAPRTPVPASTGMDARTVIIHRHDRERPYSWMSNNGIEDLLFGWRREICSSVVRRKTRGSDTTTPQPRCFFGVEGIFFVQSPEM